MHGLHAAAQRALQLGVALQGAVQPPEGVGLQLGHTLLQHQQLALALGRQLALAQGAGALGAQHAQLFAQHGRLGQRRLDQRMRVGLGVDLQAIGMHQRLVELQQRCDELRVLRRALHLLDAACGHGLLQRAPGLLGLGPGGHLGGGHLGGDKAGGHIVQGGIDRIARGGAARGQGLIAAQHAHRQAPVHLHALHQAGECLGRGHALRLQARMADGVQGVAHHQVGGQGAHHEPDGSQDEEFLEQVQTVKQ